MTNKLSIAIAAGLLLAGPVFADDKDQTRTQDQLETRDQTRDPAAAGIGTEVSELARTQARDRVRDALAAQAGMPSEPAVLRGDRAGEASGEKAAERHASQARTAETERAAQRHTERKAAREQKGEAQAGRRGAGMGGNGAGMGGHGSMAGSGSGSGDCMQAAERTRSGDMNRTGGMTPGGMH